MKPSSSHRGSALLIVLGMLAFMVISAVAFSAYMRATRMPSSYLRRSISSRMLAKAAMAEAIDEVDAAVGNFPHPNVWNIDNTTGNSTALSDSANCNRTTGSRMLLGEPPANKNAWLGRVYIGGTTTVSSVQQRLLPQNETVSTLTLEGLAYIPPPLVNEARYYSRHSSAATWHTMGFDAGRYAFCAIDVSDYFDINALTAGDSRGSAPDKRISLAYLMENEDHTQNSSSQGTQWDNFVGRLSSSQVPMFISLADWNLSMKAQSFGEASPKIKSYFYDYVKNNRTSFYGGDAESDQQKEAIRRMTFVTDGWFPPLKNYRTASNGSRQEQIDLNEDSNQPFQISNLRGATANPQHTLVSVLNYSSPNAEVTSRLKASISGLGRAALWDYLDENDQPLSLAIPTTERTPMICGLSPAAVGNSQLEIVGERDGDIVVEPREKGKCHVTYKAKYSIRNLPQPGLQALVVYPFRNRRPGSSANYSIGGRAAYFLSIGGQEFSSRTGNSSDLLHLTAGGGSDPTTQNAYKMVEQSVMTLPLTGSCPQPSTFTPSAQGQNGAVKLVALTPSAGGMPQSQEFLTATYEWDTEDVAVTEEGQPRATPKPARTTPNVSEGDQVTAASCLWQPLAANGGKAPEFNAQLAANLANPGFTCELKLNLAVWAWIKNTSTSKVVDLVPACVYDDGDLNSYNADSMSRAFGQEFLGRAYPLMRFDMNAAGTATMTVSSLGAANNAVAAAAPGASAMAVTPKSVYVGDPRYNHAPESWFCISDTDSLLEQTWLDNCGCKGRDGDIFMMTSDQCYLQSIYELANLPRLSEFYIEGSTKEMLGWYKNPANFPINRFPVGTFANGVNHEYMWRTYDPFVFPNGNTPGDDFDGVGITAAGDGYKVNPYTDSTNIMMAAFANTPLEWQFAADSERSGLSWMNSYESAATFNSQYAWNDYSSNGKIAWDDLALVAGSFMQQMRGSGGDSWEDVFNDLGWYNAAHRASGEDSEYLLGNDKLLETSMQGRLWNCDKKFLYGYWHDCFATQQQLFLIFVRAEPALMGGGSVHQTPPQLGARAMALVWRDPVNRSTTNDGTSPHRTRVLFYRQFE